jgi:hypothetical protein
MANDWLEDLHRTGDFRPLLAWLDAHKGYLKDSRSQWVRHVHHQVKHGHWILSDEQRRTFIHMRGGIEALAAWDILEARLKAKAS